MRRVYNFVHLKCLSAKQAARKYAETFSEETYSPVRFVKDIQVAWLGLAEISVHI